MVHGRSNLSSAVQDEQKLSSARHSAFPQKRYARQVHRQTLSIHDLRRPSAITAYTKQEKEAAISLARAGRSEAALTGFCDSMDALFSRAGFLMDHINYAAIVTALAHIWEAAQHNDRFRSHAGVLDGIQALYRRCVQSLRALLADMAPQQVSTVLWSSAKLGYNPDTAVPGMVHNMTLRLLTLIEVVEERQLPNAQECANVIWALATMGHPAATTELVNTVCLRFDRLTQHEDNNQRPTAQNAANMLWALATLGHPAAEVLDAVSLHFARLTRHTDAKQRPNAQAAANMLWALATMGHPAAAEVLDLVAIHFAHLFGSPNAKQRPTDQNAANVVWALGTLKHTPPDDRLLDAFLAYFHALLRSQDQRTRPGAQASGNTLWGLKELKQAPSNDVVSAMLAHLVLLCQKPGSQPTSQAISNCLLACAELRLSVRSACVQALLKHLIAMDVSRVEPQSYCNVVWSLAVMGCLTISTFDALLCQLNSNAGPVKLPASARRQLHQALAWLKPAPCAQQMEAWSTLCSRLQVVAPELAVVPLPFPGQAEVFAALKMQALPHKAQVPAGKHWAHAVLSSSKNASPQVFLVFQHPQDYIRNMPNRVLGHVAFKNKMLRRYGTVVTMPYDPEKSSVESMAGHIKAAVEAKTGLPLDSFRR
ncbi:hypothetical protein ABBQ38_013640 [Trebouxia sp. C0009 RCD-2024]